MSTATAQFGRFSGRLPDVMHLCAAMALLALVLEPIVGTLAALTFLLAGMALLMLRPAEAALHLLAFRWVLIIPLFCMASFLWSVAPAASLRSGIQLILTFAFAILVARRCPPGRFLKVLVGALTLIVALSITTGSYRNDTGALTGYFASKNAMGAASALLAVAAAGLIATAWRWGAVVAALIGLAGVVLAQSMGALVATGIGLASYPLLAILRRFSLRLQVAISIACFLSFGLMITLLVANLDAVSALVLDLTGKDITLTGRTDLWSVALAQISERPWLGLGYQGFWRIGNPEAEALWRMFGIESRSGFHFHNLYLSNAVEIGLLGAAMQTVLLLWLGGASLRLALGVRDYRAATFFALTLMVLAITPLEVPAFFAFNLQTFLLVATVVYIRDGLAALRGASGSTKLGRRSRS